jgi:hypothetical protein
MFVKTGLKGDFTPATKNVSFEPLVNPQDIYLPPLHIKLGLTKIFVKALTKEGETFTYFRKKFPRLSEAKIKEGIFIGPRVNTVIQDPAFENTLSDTEKKGWTAFKSLCFNFLGNQKSENYKEIVSEMLEIFKP